MKATVSFLPEEKSNWKAGLGVFRSGYSFRVLSRRAYGQGFL